MRAGILAAGVGRRLGDETLPPKILLSFDGKSLLERHVAMLRHCGVRRVDLIVGYRADLIEAEIDGIGAWDFVQTRFNPDYDQGAIVSLGHLRETFSSGEPVIFMDGDVLYDHRMLEQLVDSPLDNCFLLDRAIEDGEDPVKLWLRDDLLVDFHKRSERDYDWWGEWVGFSRFDPNIGAKVAAQTARLVDGGRHDALYEDPIREVVVTEPPSTFGIEDISGLPWVEIDFPEDLRKARVDVLPRLAEMLATIVQAERPRPTGS